MTHPTDSTTASLLAALLAAQESGDNDGQRLLLEGMDDDELLLGLVAAVALCREAMSYTPGGVAAWLAAYHHIDGPTL